MLDKRGNLLYICPIMIGSRHAYGLSLALALLLPGPPGASGGA